MKKSITVHSNFLPRTEAEQTYGMTIYQGGAVPGKLLRIVNIEGVDVEACGGTHMKNTSEAGEIRILKATKISDGIVRIYFTAGEAAKREKESKSGILEEASKILKVEIEELPSRVDELFRKWKSAKKAIEKKKDVEIEEFELKIREKFEGDILPKVSEILKTQPEHVVKTIKRFLSELEEMKKKIK